MLGPQVGYCERHQLLGLEKLRPLCFNTEILGSPAHGVVRALLANLPGAQLTGEEGLLTSPTRAPGSTAQVLARACLVKTSLGPADKASELRDVC